MKNGSSFFKSILAAIPIFNFGNKNNVAATSNNEPVQMGFKNPEMRKSRKKNKVKTKKSEYQKKHARMRMQKHSRQMNRKNPAA